MLLESRKAKNLARTEPGDLTPDEIAEKVVAELAEHEPEVVGYILARAIFSYRENLAQRAAKAKHEINTAVEAASQFEAGIEQFLPKSKKP